MANLEDYLGSPELPSKSSTTQASSSALKKVTGFLDFPFELRLKIYRHYVPRRRLIYLSNNWKTYTPPKFIEGTWGRIERVDLDGRPIEDWSAVPHGKKSSIFRVCKQVSEEALEILYGENIFQVYLRVYIRMFPEAMWPRIKKLELMAVPGSDDPEIGKLPWSSIFQSLDVLYFGIPGNQCYYCRLNVEHEKYAETPEDTADAKYFLERDEIFSQWCSNAAICFKHLGDCDVVLKIRPSPCKRREELIENQLLSSGYRKIQSHDYDEDGSPDHYSKAQGDVPVNGLFRRITRAAPKMAMGTPLSSDDL